MKSYSHAVIARPDTLLGVCQALGADLGFNPIYLRVALAVPLVWMPFQMFAAYLALGVLVLASRLLFPNPRVAAEASPEPVAAETGQRRPDPIVAEREEMLIAA